MIEIFINYISEFTDKSKRTFALANTSQLLAIHSRHLGTENIKTLLIAITRFDEQYKKAFPWNRGKVVAKEILRFTQTIKTNQ